MNVILIKLFATALTLSQVTTRPDAVKTQFDPATDGAQVVQILRDGCAHMRKAFDIEDINLDELITTAMEDPTTVAGDNAPKILHGLDLAELNTSYKQFCKGENPQKSPFEARAVIEFYNNAVKELPSAEALRDMKLPGASTILDAAGKPYSEAFEANGRRRVVPIAEIPELVQKAFVAAEDKRFYQHKGIDERGVIRAFIGNLAAPGRPAGGSTITQQVVKNLSVGDDVTYERKIREMIVAARLEQIQSKPQILGLYLNGIYLGRGAYGIEMAARSWFGKSVGALTVPEAALLAGLPKGPNYYSPDKYPDRARERRGYVLSRMKEDGVITEEQLVEAQKSDLGTKPVETARRDSGFYFVEHLSREARTFAGLESLTSASYTVRSTVNAGLQTATETALQEGLATYERGTGRVFYDGPEMNLSDSVTKFEALPPTTEVALPPAPAPVSEPKPASAKKAALKQPLLPKPTGPKPAWQRALEAARPVLYDVHWPLAVVISTGKAGTKVGLADGRVATLDAGAARGRLQLYDAVRVKLLDPAARAPRAQLRIRPAVQGAAIVLDNKTGKILAMTGGFSYPQSQLNRVTQTVRQPGSTLKPLTYLAALNAGLQPNTLVMDSPVTLPPIGGAGDSWSPKNYDGGGSGPTTLRRGLEFSKNLVTARLLQGGIAEKAPASLKRVCDIALEAQLYAECENYYPFVLGAQPVRMIDLASFYAAIANEGGRPSAYALESVEKDGKLVFTRAAKPPVRIGSADRVAFYQLKTMLQGVTQHGTAAALSGISQYVAGKTGTSENENDAWFAGFTNEITVVVWVGYDNADGIRKTLGRGQTGGHVSVPIAKAIFQAAWANGVPRTALAPPSPEAAGQIADIPIDPRSGQRIAGGGFLEHFRRKNGQVADTQYNLVPRETMYAMRPDSEDGDFGNSEDGADIAGGYRPGRSGSDLLDPFGSDERDPYAARRTQRYDPYQNWPGRNRYGQAQPSPFGDDGEAVQRPRRRDPDYLFGEDPRY
ncbi:penicillin-binding protein 1A [Methylobacterium haplocladii]|uniref:Penicillin-binding protein n=1 Tax=Methylobacterium haplocladii TaxID=1176176 RepID=A0A512IPP1_9HYPH|nr:transglycosylase domain-containing protein [Methylobacterium haplocladii]GEO99608.1 penicillin-binding protein [Methylobacterium haplocladii]GJD85899.1 Biosynthetic peptidoglycan transglycosylase [Methylobacterium haplocladii]GLS58584.1 penicillin-binding protein [Methylobacterium haplocladii]